MCVSDDILIFMNGTKLIISLVKLAYVDGYVHFSLEDIIEVQVKSTRFASKTHLRYRLHTGMSYLELIVLKHV